MKILQQWVNGLMFENTIASCDVNTINPHELKMNLLYWQATFTSNHS